MEKQSVVTPERFASGFTYKEYLAYVGLNKDRFEKYYETGWLSPEDGRFFRKAAGVLNGLSRILVIAEDWCPDSFRGLPVAQRIAESCGVELRIFPRDKNPDIMNEFLKEGKYASLPVVVFYTAGLKEICRWIERPEYANIEMAEIRAMVKFEMPLASETEMRRPLREREEQRYPTWQQESVKEIRQLLAEKMKL